MFRQRAGDFWALCGGYVLPFIGVLAKPWGWRAIFIAPTKLRNFLPVTFIGRHSLSFAALSSSLREGAGNGGAVPFIVPVGNRDVAGDFHRPYEKVFISPCVVLLSGWGG